MPKFKYLNNAYGAIVFLIILSLTVKPVLAQTVNPDQIPTPIPIIREPQEVLPPLPSSGKQTLEPASIKSPNEIPDSNQVTFKVDRFVFKGNTVLTTQQLEAVVAPFTGKEITLTELYAARSAVTDLYLEQGYVTSGAFIPINENQAINANGAVITIQVVEGKLEKINITGGSHLQNYVLSRLPSQNEVVNSNRVTEALLLLQQDPLIETISAELNKSSQISKTVLNILVKQREPFKAEAFLDNHRSPAVGSFQRGIQLNHANLLGLGDSLSVGYRNTDGSSTIATSYSIPINPQNGTLQFDYVNASTNIIERPFSSLDLISNARAYQFTYRQPLIRKADNKSYQEFALGLTFSRLESDSSIDGTPYPLTKGADSTGRTRISAMRFFQDWTQRYLKGAFLLRSEFSWGIDAFDATINNSAPDGQFLSWQGQAAWLRQLSSNVVLLARAEIQLADRRLAALEQFSLGGATTIRGYREDTFVADNAALISAELRIRAWTGEEGEIHVIPFIGLGTAWNNGKSDELNPDFTGTLASVGLGLQYQSSDRFNARLDWGLPLISVDTNTNSRTWQENGVYLSITYRI
ncbi:ShlB/FhaC/HecB family hemolysin secretion/activation protein [aff. Roholtiella sp. LEGE 12411]|uniref:ShlB/FhaC/HecB family hemolysin secretion/activation protein n=1 Tax=aff. Roholtiella sp. LEGE 12411 TaxID=1828822 RepID=UPI00188135D6|nr:ShlB/FhaC/HecB family hemolysin secretion/activation protein [aff. Roholtiella sp. LEGE 12411]MBE9035214.1 ShlB/FhaC/HecB family hemolysin secretion/activation protein [aff. Roholtiella sp. LEGE 12411]